MNDNKDRNIRLASRVVSGVVLIALLLIGCGTWAVWAKLEGAVIAQGSLRVDQNLKEIQHRDGGIVKSIAIRQGDFVKEGQILIALDDLQIKAELLIVRSQLLEALGRRARLVAERDDLSEISFPNELNVPSPLTNDIRNGEIHLFKGNKVNRDSRKEQLTLTIHQTGEEIKGMESRLAAKEEEIQLVGAERTKLLDLYEKKITDYSRVYTASREWARLLGERGEIEASIARAKVRASEVKLQILAIDQTASTEAQRELRVLDARIAELKERKLAIQDRIERTEIRAPVSGYINELYIHTIGGVITPAAKIATIVPEDAQLRVEIKISPADIDQVRIGQNARVRLTAFNRNTTPELAGRVTMVSPASARDAAGLEHYIAQVQLLDKADIELHGMRLIPGMPAEVYISTLERTALSYLVKPISDQMTKAFRER
ncbi:MAG: HlyD family type I secretion periplasmic adaptor subunit [Pseudomonadota bacterium]